MITDLISNHNYKIIVFRFRNKSQQIKLEDTINLPPSADSGSFNYSPNAFPSVEAAPEVSFPHPEGLSVFGFAASTFPGTNTTAAIAASTAIVVMCLMFISRGLRPTISFKYG